MSEKDFDCGSACAYGFHTNKTCTHYFGGLCRHPKQIEKAARALAENPLPVLGVTNGGSMKKLELTRSLRRVLMQFDGTHECALEIRDTVVSLVAKGTDVLLTEIVEPTNAVRQIQLEIGNTSKRLIGVGEWLSFELDRSDKWQFGAISTRTLLDDLRMWNAAPVPQSGLQLLFKTCPQLSETYPDLAKEVNPPPQ